MLLLLPYIFHSFVHTHSHMLTSPTTTHTVHPHLQPPTTTAFIYLAFFYRLFLHILILPDFWILVVRYIPRLGSFPVPILCHLTTPPPFFPITGLTAVPLDSCSTILPPMHYIETCHRCCSFATPPPPQVLVGFTFYRFYSSGSGFYVYNSPFLPPSQYLHIHHHYLHTPYHISTLAYFFYT